MPHERPAPSDADDLASRAMSKEAIAKWRRLTPTARDFLARAEGRRPLAENLRNARENRGLSQAAVAKKLGMSRSLVAQIELANRPVSADELTSFADLYGVSAVDLTGTRVATDDPVTVTLMNLAPALIKQFDMQSRIHGVLGALMATSRLTGLLERPARTGLATYPVSPPRTLADAIAQGEQVADHERQRLSLRDAPLPDIADLCAAQGVPVFALEMPDDVSGMYLADASIGSAIVVNARHDGIRQQFAIAHSYAHAVFEHAGERKGADRAAR
jgi:transcriptional regulator with XRE-family HTH domain